MQTTATQSKLAHKFQQANSLALWFILLSWNKLV